MPFFLLKLFPIELQEVQDLQYALAQTPNGTPLCCATPILSQKLLGRLRIYWMENEYATHSRVEMIKSLAGVEMFTELSDIPVTINDPDWKWDNHFIDELFSDIIMR